MKGSRTRLRKVLPEREREEAAFPIRARDKPTVSPSVRSFATSTRATGARLCQLKPSGASRQKFPLQPLRPHDARARTRARAIRFLHAGSRFSSMTSHRPRGQRPG
jgi:hypothetical protein